MQFLVLGGFDGCDQHRLARSALADLASAATQADRSGERSTAPYLDRPTSGRRFVDEDDDVAADFDDARREPLGFFLFGRRPRW